MPLKTTRNVNVVVVETASRALSPLLEDVSRYSLHTSTRVHKYTYLDVLSPEQWLQVTGLAKARPSSFHVASQPCVALELIFVLSPAMDELCLSISFLTTHHL